MDRALQPLNPNHTHTCTHTAKRNRRVTLRLQAKAEAEKNVEEDSEEDSDEKFEEPELAEFEETQFVRNIACNAPIVSVFGAIWRALNPLQMNAQSVDCE